MTSNDRIAERARAADRVIARMDELELSRQQITAEIRQGGQQAGAGVGSIPGTLVEASSVKTAAPTVAERAVDKVLAKHLVEFFRLQQAANGIAVKESK